MMLRKRARYIFLESDMSFVELLLAFLYVGWGCSLLAVSAGAVPATHSNIVMREVLPLAAWGVIFIIVGLIKAAGTLLDVSRLRAAGATLGLILWFFVALVFLAAGTQLAAAIVYGSFTVASYLVLARQLGKRG